MSGVNPVAIFFLFFFPAPLPPATLDAPRRVPMLSEVLRFPTYEHNDEAFVGQKQWLMKTAKELGFTATDAGKITEIELAAGKKNAPVLGLVVHGDVQPVDADAWTFPPFNGIAANGYVYGRGPADAKGPLRSEEHTSEL